MAKIIVAREKIDCEHLLGQFVDESHYDTLIEKDTDCYMEVGCSIIEKANCKEKDCSKCSSVDPTNERKIAFKFRKNFFSKQEQEQAYQGLREAATSSQNRGLAAGPKGEKCGERDWVTNFQIESLEYLSDLTDTVIKVDLKEEIERLRQIHKDESSSRGIVWLANEIKKDNFSFENWLSKVIKKKDKAEIRKDAKDVMSKYISDTTYANPVFSGIAGWFDRYPRIPYGRATAYTQNHYDKFEMAFPFLQSLDRGFKELLPWRWGNQRAAADKIDPRFLVPDTVFTTITVNKTFRTACHRDAGDFTDGLSNLLVLSNNGKYRGGYLVFPEYRVAVNVRPGDLLLVNNHEIIHGNTPIEPYEDGERISLVCYLREKMLELGSYEYETHRFEFVESRRKNPEHPMQRKLWNGISKNCFSDSQDPKQDWEAAKEWYEFLKNKPNGYTMLKKYHPWLIERFEHKNSLESLFG
jgi:hypothetical protein